MAEICTIPELRHGLVVAHALAKAHVAFVVVPALSREEFIELSLLSAQKLEAVAAKGGGA